MADVPEVLRLVRHAANMLDESEAGVLAAFLVQHRDARERVNRGDQERVISRSQEYVAANSLAITVLNLVAAFMAETPTAEEATP